MLEKGRKEGGKIILDSSSLQVQTEKKGKRRRRRRRNKLPGNELGLVQLEKGQLWFLEDRNGRRRSG